MSQTGQGDDSIQTCPKHGLKFNRKHYFECEMCRGAHLATNTVESPLSPEAMKALVAGGALLVAVIVVWIGVALTRDEVVDHSGPDVVGMPCVETCTERTHECLVDCASVRDDQCTAACMPQLESCAKRCQPRLRLRNGAAVISSGLADPGVEAEVLRVYGGVPPDELPDRAYVRLSIDGVTGKVHAVLVHADPDSSADTITSLFEAASFPVDPRNQNAEPGRHDKPYIVYLVIQPP
jgi:hypothetical protein